MSGPVLTQPGGGGVVPRTKEDAEVLAKAFGTPEVSSAERDAALREGRLRDELDTASNKVATFAEGVANAISDGLVYEPGDEADRRRSVNKGSAIAGNIIGTIIAFETGAGPSRAIAETGEALGKMTARSLFRSKAGSITERALAEAGAGAAITGSMAYSHQLVDSVVEDKEFSSEAILDEMKLGGLIGLAGGGVMGAFGKVATRADMAAQRGLVGDVEVTSQGFNEALKGYDQAVAHHSIEMGVLKELQENGRLGVIPDAFMDVRKAALQNAERAQAALRELDIDKALSGADAQAYKQWQGAAERYRKAVRDLDEIMMPDKSEIAAEQAYRAGNKDTIIDLNPRGGFGPGRDVTAAQAAGGGGPSYLDEYFAANPDAAAHYEKIYGQPYEPTPRAPGGVVTPTSELKTNAGGGPPTTAAAPVSGGLDDLNKLVFGDGAAAPASKAADTIQTHWTPPAADRTILEEFPAGATARSEEAAARRAARAKTTVDQAPFGAGQTDTVYDAKPFGDITGKVDAWMSPGRPRPFHEAEAKMQAAMDRFRSQAGSRLNSAGSLDLLRRAGIKPSTDPLVAHADSLWAMRHASRLAADEARGVATSLRESAADAIKSALAGHVVGAVTGSSALGFAAQMMGFGGRLGSASGRLLGRAVLAAGKLLNSTRLRAVAVAATNQPYAYTDQGPIADPVERIEEIKFLAQNPGGVMAKVAEACGPLNQTNPELVRALQMRAVNQVTSLSLRAPAIYYDNLGRPMSPPAGELRSFYEYENGMHDLNSLLAALGNGTITSAQAQALADGFPSVHMRIAQSLLSDPEKLRSTGRPQLRVIETITGAQLTQSSDPMFIVRQAEAWAPVDQPQAPQKPQAFNINPAGAPTPSQSNASGRAPGN